MFKAHQFYPTPHQLIALMEARITMPTAQRVYLEPSAGKGDIVDYLTRKDRTPRVYVVEQDPTLRATLVGKKYRLVGADFLEYQNKHGINCILMNPPFADGCEHLLHAWNILDHGEIVCILNAETLRKTYTAKRKLLIKIIEEHGNYQFMEQAFSEAERKTNVEIAVVYLHKPQEQSYFNVKLNRDSSPKTLDIEELVQSSGVMQVDQLDLTISYFDEAVQALAAVVKAMDVFKQSCIGLITEADAMPILKTAVDGSGNVAYSQGYDDLTKAAWKRIFTETSIGSLIGSKFQKDFDNSMNAAGLIEFSRDNILGLYRNIAEGYKQVQMQNVLHVWDTLTRYDKNNCIYPEGWVTNSAFKVNRKFILPNVVNEYGHTSHYMYSTLSDLEKAMCYVSGISYKSIYDSGYTAMLGGRLSEALRQGKYEADTQFFHVKMYKKGTGHFTFKDDFIWQRFNELVCEGKNWIPSSVNDRKQTKRKKK